MSNMFEGLEDLGFNNLDEFDIYRKDAPPALAERVIDVPIPITPEDYLFDKTYMCPVCYNEFVNHVIKHGKPLRLISTDTDLRARYEPIDPIYYDVLLCPKCGYAALQPSFGKMGDKTGARILKEITPNYKPKAYPKLFEAGHVIERYKLALLNSVIKGAKDGEKAYLCLRIAWLYRDLKDTAREVSFQKQAVQGFVSSLENRESYPLFELDQPTVMYIIAETYRRLDDYEEASRWFNRLSAVPALSQRLKDRLVEQRARLKKDKEVSETEAHSIDMARMSQTAEVEPEPEAEKKPEKEKTTKNKSWFYY